MLNLPEKFVSRARAALGDEAEEFLSAYSFPPVKGIRVNSLKISPAEFKKISPFALEEVPWEENGFYVTEEKVGSHPYHAAGLYYSQEPSAMFPASLLDVSEGDRVLDLCSAPGGKGTQLARKMNGKGIIVLNEYVSSRAKILSGNVERLGIKNAVVLNESPGRLEGFFPSYFDKILVDAPCSGEGMFRKNPEEALSNWSEENIFMCAERQKEILSSAAKMLAGGGRMVYSTCTFSPEEDERQTENFLKTHPEFTLIKEEKLLPHNIKGEGHYAVLFEKSGGERLSLRPVKGIKEDKDIALYRGFEKEFLNIKFKNLFRAGNLLYALPDEAFDFSNLNVLRAGVRLGEFLKGRFEPSHSLAMCLKREEIKNFVSFDGTAAEKYLRGESLSVSSSLPSPSDTEHAQTFSSSLPSPSDTEHAQTFSSSLPSPLGEGGAAQAVTDEGCKAPAGVTAANAETGAPLISQPAVDSFPPRGSQEIRNRFLDFARNDNNTAAAPINNGWCVVGIGDYPLGLGKISGGVIKNHYPKGLRTLK